VLETSIGLLLRNLKDTFNPLNVDLNPICHLLALIGAHHILHVSRIRVKGEEIVQPTFRMPVK
jgi:hypothetical protein